MSGTFLSFIAAVLFYCIAFRTAYRDRFLLTLLLFVLATGFIAIGILLVPMH